MRSFKKFINEAKNPVPSALKKFKKGSEKKINTYIAGDIYDLSANNRYQQEDSYYKGDGDGYIMSKDGKIYDITCSEWTSDSGRIVGGSFNNSLTIYRVGPEQENISLSGYSGCFSSPSSPTYGSIISDVEAGMYLEDYLAKHERDIDWQTSKKDWVISLVKAGDPKAKTVKVQKKEKKIQNELNFNARYVLVNGDIKVKCTGGSSLEYVKPTGWNGKELMIARIIPSKTKNDDKGWRDQKDRDVDVPEDVNTKITEAFLSPCEDVIKAVFGGADCKGLMFSFFVTFEGEQKDTWHKEEFLAWDTKENKFVAVMPSKRKVLDRKIAFNIQAVMYKKDVCGELSKYVKTILTDASKIMLTNLGKQAEYIQRQIDLKKSGSRWYWPTSKDKKELATQWREIHDQQKFEPNKDKEYMIDIVTLKEILKDKDYSKFKKTVAVSAPKDAEENDVATPEITDGPDKPKASSKSAEETYGKAYGPAKEKMEKWHAGTRKQNLKNCNDGKLRMNFSICKELGYEEECKQIAAEAKKRGIILESKLSLSHYIQAIFG